MSSICLASFSFNCLNCFLPSLCSLSTWRDRDRGNTDSWWHTRDTYRVTQTDFRHSDLQHGIITTSTSSPLPCHSELCILTSARPSPRSSQPASPADDIAQFPALPSPSATGPTALFPGSETMRSWSWGQEMKKMWWVFWYCTLLVNLLNFHIVFPEMNNIRSQFDLTDRTHW